MQLFLVIPHHFTGRSVLLTIWFYSPRCGEPTSTGGLVLFMADAQLNGGRQQCGLVRMSGDEISPSNL